MVAEGVYIQRQINWTVTKASMQCPGTLQLGIGVTLLCVWHPRLSLHTTQVNHRE